MHIIKLKFNCWSNFILENWIQYDQGGGDGTCLQAHRGVLLRILDPRGRRSRRRSTLTYEHRKHY